MVLLTVFCFMLTICLAIKLGNSIALNHLLWNELCQYIIYA